MLFSVLNNKAGCKEGVISSSAIISLLQTAETFVVLFDGKPETARGVLSGESACA